MLADALISAEAISREATQMVADSKIDGFSVLLGQLAGINSTNQ